MVRVGVVTEYVGAGFKTACTPEPFRAVREPPLQVLWSRVRP